MAKISRYNGDVRAFGSTAIGTDRTIFGDVTQSDTLDDNINANFLTGWGILTAGAKPPKQYFNGALYTATQLIAYLHEVGIPEWNTNQKFYIGSLTLGSDGAVYSSVIGTDPTPNTGTNPATVTDETVWKIAANPYKEGSVTHDITVDADYTLTALQNKYGRIEITDTGVLLTTGRNITVDNVQGRFIFVNSTAQTLTPKTSAGTGIAVAAGATVELYNDGTNVIEAVDNSFVGGLTTNDFLHIQDQRTSGTNGGNSVAGEQTRVLNTILTNNISGASLSTNQITLPAGTYYVEASAPSKLRNHQVYLDNITDVTRTVVGESMGNNIQDVFTRSALSGIFTIASAKVFELVHYILSADTNGLGLAISNDIEVYSDVKIWKVG